MLPCTPRSVPEGIAFRSPSSRLPEAAICRAGVSFGRKANHWVRLALILRPSHRRRLVMSAVLTKFHGALLCLPLLAAALAPSPQASAADVYDNAVQHPGRPADDLKRDGLEHPAEVLRLAGIKPGMQVADVMAYTGYYSELLSYVVGPKGHVLMLNNAAYDHYSEGGWEKRL